MFLNFKLVISISYIGPTKMTVSFLPMLAAGIIIIILKITVKPTY